MILRKERLSTYINKYILLILLLYLNIYKTLFSITTISEKRQKTWYA